MRENYIDNSVNPGTDFYKYATGNFVKMHPQPADMPSWDVFGMLEEDLLIEQIKDIERSLRPEQGPIEKKMCDYMSVLRNPRRQTDGFSVVRPYIDKLWRFETKEEILQYAISGLFVESPVEICVTQDYMDSRRYAVFLSQNLLLHNKEYYKPGDETMKKFKEVSLKVIRLCGYDEEYAKRLLDAWFCGLENYLVDDAITVEEMEDVEACYNPVSVDDMSIDWGFDIRKFLSWFGMDKTDVIIVDNPDYMESYFRRLDDIDIDTLRLAIEFSLIISSADSLSDEISDAAWEFSQFKTGAKERTPKWKRELYALAYGPFAEYFGKLYCDRFFNGDAKQKVIEYVRRLKNSFRDIISHQDWMSDSTREAALKKLDSMGYTKIGFPEKLWQDYDRIIIDPYKSLFENGLLLDRYSMDYTLEHYYNKDADPEEWPMLPHSINACYVTVWPNEICFPAGILQSPFFDSDASDAENLGAIGTVIGHEMTHGFDRTGRMFDFDGNMNDWWTAEDAESFNNNMNEPIIAHFSKYNVLPFVKCNGELQAAENLADSGGLRIALEALKKILSEKGCSEEERLQAYREFFISFASVWAGVQTTEIIKNDNMNGTHSAPFLRVNAQVVLFDEWYEAFGITKEDLMYIPKEERVRGW